MRLVVNAGVVLPGPVGLRVRHLDLRESTTQVGVVLPEIRPEDSLLVSSDKLHI